jgi:hypothetical protein
MEEKTKKKRVQKRAVRKTAKAAELVSTAASPVVTTETKKPRKSSGKANKAKATSKTPKVISLPPTFEQVQVRAYFISESRRKLGLPGDEGRDWLAAERELLAELKVSPV